MTVTLASPVLTAVRNVLAATLNAEFINEGIVFGSVPLNSQAAWNDPSGAVVSMGWRPAPNINEILVRHGIQIFDAYGADFDPTNQTYDPTTVEAWAERAILAIKANEHNTAYWYLQSGEVQLSHDSAGNPSQVEIEIVTRRDNPFGF